MKRSLSEVRDQRSEIRKSEVGEQMSEVRGQKSEIRNQKSEVRDQMSEIRCQRSENQRTEITVPAGRQGSQKIRKTKSKNKIPKKSGFKVLKVFGLQSSARVLNYGSSSSSQSHALENSSVLRMSSPDFAVDNLRIRRISLPMENCCCCPRMIPEWVIP